MRTELVNKDILVYPNAPWDFRYCEAYRLVIANDLKDNSCYRSLPTYPFSPSSAVPRAQLPTLHRRPIESTTYT